MELYNDTCNTKEPKPMAEIIARVIKEHGAPQPGFYFFRTTWISPAIVRRAVAALQASHPELGAELVNPRSFFGLFRQAKGQ
jgi:hypothetical protein